MSEQRARELIHQLDKRHDTYAAHIVSDHQDPPLHGVNVWENDTDRYPTTTAWFGETITWGPNFDWEVPAEIDMAELADRIKETL